MSTEGNDTLCIVVLSFYVHASLPWKLRSDSDLQIRAVVKVMFIAGHYDVSFRRVRPLRKTNLHPRELNITFGIISINVWTGTLWQFQCINLFGIGTTLHCLQHSLQLSLPIVTMLHYIMFRCLLLLPRNNYWASPALKDIYIDDSWQEQYRSNKSLCNCKLVSKTFTSATFMNVPLTSVTATPYTNCRNSY